MDKFEMMPGWVFAYSDGSGWATDDQPGYVLAFTKKQLAEDSRQMSRNKNMLRVTFMPLIFLQELVAKTPAIEGVSLVFYMGPLVLCKGEQAREIKKARIKRAAFLSIHEDEHFGEELR